MRDPDGLRSSTLFDPNLGIFDLHGRQAHIYVVSDCFAMNYKIKIYNIISKEHVDLRQEMVIYFLYQWSHP